MSRALVREPFRRRPLDVTARLRAVEALPEEASSCPALLAAARDPSLEVAKRALGRLASLSGPNEIAALRGRLLTVDLALVPAYADALRSLGDLRAVYEASAGLESHSVPTRLAAATALLELASPLAARALRDATVDPIAGVRRTALEALAELGPDADAETAAVARLSDRDAYVRAAAVTTLARIAVDPDGRLRRVLEDPASEVRRELAHAVAKLAAPTLERLLEDADADVRETALWALAAAPRVDVVPCVLGLLDDPRWQVRRAGCRALGAAGAREAVPELTLRLADAQGTVRLAALRALGELEGTRLPDVLRRRLRHPDPDVRAAVVYALAALAGTRALASLDASADDPSAPVRAALAAAIRPLGGAARPTLARLAGDPDPSVRHAAETGLDLVGEGA